MGAYSLSCGLYISISNSDQPDVLKPPPFREVGYYEKCRIVIWQKIEKNTINKNLIEIYLVPQSDERKQLIDNLASYFQKFYNFCFELENNNMLKGEINFKY